MEKLHPEAAKARSLLTYTDDEAVGVHDADFAGWDVESAVPHQMEVGGCTAGAG